VPLRQAQLEVPAAWTCDPFPASAANHSAIVANCASAGTESPHTIMVTYLRHPAGQWRQIGGLLRLNDRLRRNSNVTATGRYWPQVAVQISMEHAVMMTKRGEESVARGRHVKFILAAND